MGGNWLEVREEFSFTSLVRGGIVRVRPLRTYPAHWVVRTAHGDLGRLTRRLGPITPRETEDTGPVSRRKLFNSQCGLAVSPCEGGGRVALELATIRWKLWRGRFARAGAGCHKSQARHCLSAGDMGKL